MTPASHTRPLDTEHRQRLVVITGGIGAGKSVVSRVLRAMGYSVYDCDSEARRLMDSSGEMKRLIAERISPDAVAPDGTLRRDVIASVVFTNPDKLRQLNSIVHSAVRADLLSWAQARPSEPLLFVETAIAGESGIDRMASEVWVVTAPQATRVSRVMARSGLTDSEVNERMASQTDGSALAAMPGSRIIDNADHSALLPQILRYLDGNKS